MAQNDTNHVITMQRPVELSPGVRGRAARFVASNALDRQDCAELLEMLGLDATEGVRR